MRVSVEFTCRLCKIYMPPVGFMDIETTDIYIYIYIYIYILQSIELLNFVVTLCLMYFMY